SVDCGWRFSAPAGSIPTSAFGEPPFPHRPCPKTVQLAVVVLPLVGLRRYFLHVNMVKHRNIHLTQITARIGRTGQRGWNTRRPAGWGWEACPGRIVAPGRFCG